jgi:peroxiredoxin
MLNVGDNVPDFELPLAFADGKKDKVSFRSLLGKGPIVVAFYPLAFSGICTKEMCEVRDSQTHLENLHAATVGFSVDTPFANINFAKANNIKHGLFCDANREVVNKIWSTMTVAGVENVAKRGWLVITKDGKVAEKWVSEDPTVWSGTGPIEAALSKN